MAFYRKNIGQAHRTFRIILGLGAAAAGATWLSGIIAFGVAASGICVALSGVVGWCPACAATGIGENARS